MKQEKVFIQLQATRQEREMLAELAAKRERSMSEVVRQWIHNAHRRLNK